ncbi:MAG: hypothetical protein D6723_07730 [Acidobacteria bacterium]|nr:MAG: hypothetical protein D6723_07730 [Acidobacteriota bacterium]
MTGCESKRKPRKCPVCGSSRIARILYGLPPPDLPEKLKNDLDAGRIVFGGCIVFGDDPTWQCVNCGTSIFRKRVQKRLS